MDTTECGKCHTVLDERSDIQSDHRQPCPHCGSLSRHFTKELSDTVPVHADLAAKAKRPGEKKPFLEQKTGDDFHHASGTWRKRSMVVDRENNRYKKVVVDPATGEEVYRKEEPLSEHRGRGSAKPARQK